MGAGVNIGAGTITCNYDGANKHRTRIGNDVFIGSDTQLVAPVSVGDGATIGAGTTMTRDVPPGQLDAQPRGAGKSHGLETSGEEEAGRTMTSLSLWQRLRREAGYADRRGARGFIAACRVRPGVTRRQHVPVGSTAGCCAGPGFADTVRTRSAGRISTGHSPFPRPPMRPTVTPGRTRRAAGSTADFRSQGSQYFRDRLSDVWNRRSHCPA